MKEKKKAGKRTVSRQFTIIFVGLMAGVILSCLLANELLLEKYYVYKKQEALFDSYERIAQEQSQGNYDREQFVATLNELALRYNISMCILDSESETQYVSTNGGEFLGVKLLGYIFKVAPPNATVIKKTEAYVLQRTREKNQQYLELYGRLDNGMSFLLQSTIESIRESARLGVTFFGLVGLFGIAIGAVIIASVTRRITKPLRELNDLSDRMVHLDFEAKYEGNAKNEIGTLGENMNAMSASLESTISELKTANNELQKDIEKKEQIDEMRKEFLANVSHELKTPIALIQGYAEGLMDNVSDDPADRAFYCEVIIDEANKMNRLVKQLLSLNQLESGNDVVSMERFNITAMINGCLEQARLLLEEQGCRLLYEQYPDCYVWGDEFKLEEVFTNYLSNAIHHCDGKKEIEVKLTQEEKSVRVSVFNTGQPIPEESLPFIWDKFYKVDKARTREYGGSGVGLSIVKAIMESMNQSYGVRNFTNGVQFWFEVEKL